MSRIVLPGHPLIDGATALRPWRDTDVVALTKAARDPEISRWTAVPVNYTDSDARAYLLQRYDAITRGMMAPFAIVDASEPQAGVLGSISLMRLNWRHRRGEVGYWLAKGARGRGHATRAVRQICRWGFASLGLERVDLMAATGNDASQRVAQRAGFTREAVLRSYLAGKEGRQDMVAFGLLADDFSSG